MQGINEDQRLEALVDLNLLDTPDELEYDQLVHLASQICEVPISLISLVDKNRQWFKAGIGLSVKETHRNLSFCSHAILQPELFIVEDAAADDRFKDNALVTDDPRIRFYAGIPIHAPNGAPVGTLCVIDTQPRSLNEGQKQALTILGLQVQARMQLRHQKSLLEKTLAENQLLNQNMTAANSLFEEFMNNGPFISYIKDPEGRFIFYNRQMSDRFGADNRSWIGKSVHDLFPLEMADEYRNNDLKVIAAGHVQESHETTLSPDGQQNHWNSYKFPIQNADGETLLAGISVDVTEDRNRQKALSLANAELERLATTDMLTGLVNRRVFQNRIEIEFSVVQRHSRPLSLIILDIDNFKKRNDKLGHAAGDQALRFVGTILLENTRKEDLPVRLGGEEFAILMPDTDAESAHKLACRIQTAMRSTPGAPANLTASIGIACTSPATPTWEHLFSQADLAMYQAKRTGKNKIMLHKTEESTVARSLTDS